MKKGAGIVDLLRFYIGKRLKRHRKKYGNDDNFSNFQKQIESNLIKQEYTNQISLLLKVRFPN